MTRRRSENTDKGAALVEFAIILPVFALMLFGMVQFGLAFAGWSQLRNKVQVDARLLSLANPPCATVAACESWIANDISSTVGTTGAPQVTIYYDASKPGPAVVVVCASVGVNSFTGFFGPLDLSSRSEFYLDNPVPSLQSTPSTCTPSAA